MQVRSTNISPEEPRAMNEAEMIAKWDEHIGYEFSTRDVSSTIATMVEDAYVNHIPVMTGGYGHAALRRFYAEDFISLMPADTSIKLISRTLGKDQLVDEMIFSFTHTEEMPWMLPGVPPPHCHVAKQQLIAPPTVNFSCERIRSLFPALHEEPRLIFFDNGAGAQIPRGVFD